MNVAYLVLAHHKPQQLTRLVSLLPGQVFVHVDAKSDITAFDPANSNAHFLQTRVDVRWGTFRSVEAILLLIQAALDHGVERLLLLSGVDYPIKDPAQLETFLLDNSDREFVTHASIPREWSGAKYRYAFSYTASTWINRKIARLGKLTRGILPGISPPAGITMYGGSAWWCLTRQAAEYCLKFAQQQSELLTLLQRTGIADEHYFHTVLMNSEFKSKVVNQNFHAIEFEGAHPKIYRLSDLQTLLSSPAIFARKFDSSVDSEILKALDNAVGFPELSSQFCNGL
jgi:Core-2/I-Branching enzyme